MQRGDEKAITPTPMSLVGQKRTFALQKVMSALPPKADTGQPIHIAFWLPVYDSTL
jgi:hypothetical protein